MKKIISLIIVLLAASGCVATDKDSIYKSLEATIAAEENRTYSNRANNITNYLDYYMPSDLAEKDADNTTLTFTYNDSCIVYNINIADIINNRYYSSRVLDGNVFFNEDYLILKHSGVIVTSEGDKDYVVEIYRAEDDYLISFYDVDSQLYAYATAGDVREVLRNIYILAKTAETDEDKIINDYSDKDVISSTKKTVDLFSYIYPSTGYLSDLVTSGSTSNETGDSGN